MGFWEGVSKGFDLAIEAIKGLIEFQKHNYFNYLKYYVVSLLAGVAGFVLMLGAALAIGYAGGAIVLIPLLAALALATGAVSLSPILNSVRFVASGARQPFFSGEDYVPAAKYFIFYYAVLVIAAVLCFLPFISNVGAPDEQGSYMLGWMLLGISIFLILFMIFNLLFFYGIYEIAADRIGPFHAFSRSYAMVKSNFWETLTFALLMLAANFALNILASIILIPMRFLMFLSFWLIIVYYIASVILSMLITAALSPAYVMFWQKVRNRQNK